MQVVNWVSLWIGPPPVVERRKNFKHLKGTQMDKEKKTPDWGEELTSAQLEGVSGGVANPFVEVVMLAAKEAFYKAMWYSSVGWKDFRT